MKIYGRGSHFFGKVGITVVGKIRRSIAGGRTTVKREQETKEDNQGK